MKFICPHCKEIVERDMRLKVSRMFMTKRGYRSYCEETGKDVVMKPLP